MTMYQVVQTTADGETAIIDYNLSKGDCFLGAMQNGVSWAVTTCEEMPTNIPHQMFNYLSDQVGVVPAAIIIFVVGVSALAAFAGIVAEELF